MLLSRFLPVICIVLLLASFCHASLIGSSYPGGKVTEITKVDGGGDFRCRISGKSLIAGARLKVHVRGADSISNADAAKAFTEAAFKQAKVIRLTNVRLRNYFRVIADVEIDGKNLADELVKQDLTKSVKPAALDTGAIKTTSYLPRTKLSDAGSTRQIGTKSIGRTVMAARKKHMTNSQITNSMKSSPVVLGGEGFKPDMTFEEAIEQIRNSFSPELPIVVLWPEIERNCFVERDTPIGIEWNGKITAKKGLELLLMSVAQSRGPGLQYYVDGGIVTIASNNLKLDKRVLRVYNVAELTSVSPTMNRGYGNQDGYGNQIMYGNQGGYGNQGMYGNSRNNRSNRNSRNRPFSGGR
ncbi:MAG: hypothetical protein K9M75_05925 [Phycisphaerae bacterium]|nr:hypothetical protein [Phycisphaerae bacterium]